jgi:glycosyltransferase involved in cell wall biosynthesis
MSSDPLRVCYMIDRLLRGGTELRLTRLIRHLDRNRIAPHLVLLDGQDSVSRSLEPGGIPVLRLGIRRLRSPRNLLLFLQLRRFLRDSRIDVLELYFPDSTTFGVPAAKAAGVRRIVTTSFNLQHDASWFDRLRERCYRPCVDATITNCEAARTVACQRLPAPWHSRVRVLRNGIDIQEEPPPTLRIRPEGEAWRIGMLGNLRPVKDPESFLRAAAALSLRRSDVEFRLAGDGPLRPALERLCDELRIAGLVRFVGAIDNPSRFLQELDVFVLPSRAEGLSNAVLEAMAAGRPVVATDVGGNPELIRDGVTGVLAPPGDPAALAAAVDALLDSPPTRQRLGAAARQRVEKQFTNQAMAERFAEFYQELVGRESNPKPM